MKRKNALSIALVISLLFLIVIWKGGVFNMVGYAIYLSIYFPSPEAGIKNETLIIHSFDVLCAIGVFFIVYKAIRIITNNTK